MSLRHSVVLTWVDGVTAEQLTAVTTGLDRLKERIPNIERFDYGPDLGINDGNAAYAIVADFASVDDYVAYRDHPEHQQYLTEVIRPILSQRVAVQYELADD